MALSPPDLSTLFEQLGLASDETSIERFIQQHSPLPADQRLADAPFWDPSQARFLHEKLLQDAEWAAVIDQLNLLLRA